MRKELLAVGLAVLVFVSVLLAVDRTENYYTLIVWKVEADSAKTYMGTWTFSDSAEATKNDEYRWIKWINKYKVFGNDEDCDRLMAHLVMMTLDETNNICCTYDTVFCYTVDFRTLYGGTDYIKYE